MPVLDGPAREAKIAELGGRARDLKPWTLTGEGALSGLFSSASPAEQSLGDGANSPDPR